MWDIFGYIGTIIVIISFTIEDIYKLRICNTIGCIFWIIYGFGINAIPTIVVNACIIIVHLRWFWKNSK
jgi:hypothetical protein